MGIEMAAAVVVELMVMNIWNIVENKEKKFANVELWKFGENLQPEKIYHQILQTTMTAPTITRMKKTKNMAKSPKKIIKSTKKVKKVSIKRARKAKKVRRKNENVVLLRHPLRKILTVMTNGSKKIGSQD